MASRAFTDETANRLQAKYQRSNPPSDASDLELACVQRQMWLGIRPVEFSCLRRKQLSFLLPASGASLQNLMNFVFATFQSRLFQTSYNQIKCFQRPMKDNKGRCVTRSLTSRTATTIETRNSPKLPLFSDSQAFSSILYQTSLASKLKSLADDLYFYRLRARIQAASRKAKEFGRYFAREGADGGLDRGFSPSRSHRRMPLVSSQSARSRTLSGHRPKDIQNLLRPLTLEDFYSPETLLETTSK